MSKKIASGDMSMDERPAGLQRLALPTDHAGTVFLRLPGEVSSVPRGHRHVEWEFNLVTRGRAAYVVDGRRVPLEIDSLMWLLPSQWHVLLERSADFHMWIGVVRPEVIRRLAKDDAFAPWRVWLRRKQPPPPQHRLIGEDAARHLGNLCEHLATPPRHFDTPPALPPAHHTAGLTFLTAQAWAAFLDAPDRPAGSHLHEAVQRAVNWLADHAHRPEADDLDTLAQRYHVSRPHLSRLFKEQTGQTLTDFRNRQRVERFIALLGRGGRLNLTQAAYAAGFGSYAQTYRVIKKFTGQNPHELLNGIPETSPLDAVRRR